MLSRFLKSPAQRVAAAVVSLLFAFWLAVVIGGILLNATVIVSATYIGTLLTLSRIPNEVPAQASRFTQVILKPLVIAKRWLFNHPLVLTITLGVVTGLTMGLNTVTGVACLAISALLGDLLVAAFLDGLLVWENPRLVGLV